MWTVTLGVGYADETDWYKKLTESEFPNGPKRSELSYRVIFTTGLTKNDQPVNSLKKISINEERSIFMLPGFQFLMGNTTTYVRCSTAQEHL